MSGKHNRNQNNNQNHNQNGNGLKYTTLERFCYPPGGVVTLDWIKDEISSFYVSDTYTTAIFTPLLDSNHRRIAHLQAQDLHLTSKSIGKEEERCLFIHKNIPKDEIARRQKKEWACIPIGISRIFESFEATFYLGSGIDARQEGSLKDHHITHILNFSSKWEEEKYGGIEYASFYLPEKSTDDELVEMMDALEGAFGFINEVISAGRSSYLSNSARILFHCIDGNTKSAAMLIAYLIKFQNFNLRCAYELVKERRPQISPSTHMMRFLCHFEISIRGGDSTMTLKDWVIPAKQKIDLKNSAKLKKGISKVAKEEIALQWLPLDKLINCADEVCQGHYDEGKMEEFIKCTLHKIQNDYLVEQEMKEKSFKWADVEHTLIERAKDWFTDRIHQKHYCHNSPQSESEDSFDLLFA